MEPGGQPGLANQSAKPVHRFDPKTGEKIGESMTKRAAGIKWLGIKCGIEALKPYKAKNGVWAVRALGEGQTPRSGIKRTGELMYFREG